MSIVVSCAKYSLAATVTVGKSFVKMIPVCHVSLAERLSACCRAAEVQYMFEIIRGILLTWLLLAFHHTKVGIKLIHDLEPTVYQSCLLLHNFFIS